MQQEVKKESDRGHGHFFKSTCNMGINKRQHVTWAFLKFDMGNHDPPPPPNFDPHQSAYFISALNLNYRPPHLTFPFPFSISETAALCPGSLSSDGICIFAPQPQTVASWDVAYGACAAENGHLAVVTSQERDRLVLDVMERSQIRKAWIGLREEDTPWYWVKGSQKKTHFL